MIFLFLQQSRVSDYLEILSRIWIAVHEALRNSYYLDMLSGYISSKMCCTIYKALYQFQLKWIDSYSQVFRVGVGFELGPSGTSIELLLRSCKPLNLQGTWMKVCYNFYYSNCNGNQKYAFQLKYQLYFLNIPEVALRGYISIAIAKKVAKNLASLHQFIGTIDILIRINLDNLYLGFGAGVEPGPPGSQSRCSTIELLLTTLRFFRPLKETILQLKYYFT